VTDWPEKEYGNFYDGDSYIVLNVIMKQLRIQLYCDTHCVSVCVSVQR